jgi:hypothetical protein
MLKTVFRMHANYFETLLRNTQLTIYLLLKRNYDIEN